MPQLTVLMTVYNGATFLRETIQSVLNQSYRDFIFLILDNASTDGGRDIIKSINDPRIQLVELPQNIGQIAALNKGLDMINTPMLARMDADDIILPHRFQRQVDFLDSHPEIGICSSFAITFEGKKEVFLKWACAPEEIKVQLLFECALAHPAVMMRTALLNQHYLRYDETLGHSEDWDLWQRAARCFPLANIPEFLLRYRLHEKNESNRISDRQQQAAEKLDSHSLRLLHLDTHPLRPIHRDVANTTFKAQNRGPEFLESVVQWFQVLEAANEQHRIYQTGALRRFLKERLFVVLHYNTMFKKTALTLFFKEKLYCHVGLYRSIKFILKVVLSRFLVNNKMENQQG